jgi:hypothetical protein
MASQRINLEKRRRLKRMAFANCPVPHLLGRVSYPPDTPFRPDGDTIHLFDPVLLLQGQAIQPQNNRFKVFVTGTTKPKILNVKSNKNGAYFTDSIRGHRCARGAL